MKKYHSSLLILSWLFVNLYADPLEITDFTNVSSCDYLVICPDSFVSCGVKLAAYRNSYQSDDVENARAVSLSTITQKFPVDDSCPRAYSLWYALKYAVENWSVTPEYVVLLGDDSVKVQEIDTFVVKTQSVGLMPTFYYNTFIQKKIRGTITICDTLLDFSDAPLLSVVIDSVPPQHGTKIHYERNLLQLPGIFALGRIPVKTIDECVAYINKVISYEQRGMNSYTYNRMILAADDAKQGELLDPIPSIRHHQLAADNIAEKCFNGCFLDKTYLASFPRSSSGNHEQARVHFFDAINKGARCAVYFGHGHPDSVSDEGFLRASDTNLFSNDSFPFMFFSFSCSNGEFLRKSTPQMCKTFLLLPNGGCIAYVAATAPTYAASNENFGLSIFSQLDSSSLSISIGKTLLNAFSATMNEINFYYQVLGDPALQFAKKRIKSQTIISSTQNGDVTITTKTVSPTISPLNYHYQTGIRDSVTCIDGLSPKYLDDSIVSSFGGVSSNGQIVVTIPKSALTEKTFYTLYAWDETAELRLDTSLVISTAVIAASIASPEARQFHFNHGILTIVLPEQSRAKEAAVALYAVNGALVKMIKTPLTDNSVVLDMKNAGLPAGNYIFKLTAQTQQIKGMFCNIRM
ncbi:MAG TPA: C25 family cysteine peptidase [Chitinispirillaceae bacterium]|nr:C25 family cysteine peptidase [Chitinispirillaceae bacterium]